MVSVCSRTRGYECYGSESETNHRFKQTKDLFLFVNELAYIEKKNKNKPLEQRKGYLGESLKHIQTHTVF